MGNGDKRMQGCRIVSPHDGWNFQQPLQVSRCLLECFTIAYTRCVIIVQIDHTGIDVLFIFLLKSLRELEGISLRYWNKCKGGVVEHVVDVKLTEDMSVKSLMNIAETTLAGGLMSNTFDGTSVMSGEKGQC